MQKAGLKPLGKQGNVKFRQNLSLGGIASLIFALGVGAAGAAETGNALKQQLVDGAEKARSLSFAFTRTTKSEASIGKEGPHLVVEKYEPKGKWTLVSIDGHAPSAEEMSAYQKPGSQRRVPAYDRVAAYLANAVPAAPDRRGRAVFHFDSLPKETTIVMETDVSGNAVGDVYVNTGGPTPFVEEVRMRVNRAIRIKLIAKMESWEGTTRFRFPGDGHPFPVEQTSDVVGSILGKSGKIHSVSTYSDVRLVNP